MQHPQLHHCPLVANQRIIASTQHHYTVEGQRTWLDVSVTWLVDSAKYTFVSFPIPLHIAR